MFNKESANEIKNLVFDTIGYKTATEFEVTESDGVFAEKKDGKITVGGKTIPMLARAFFLAGMKEKNGEESFKVEEKPHFSRIGAMLDVSRNGVLKVESVKKYINYMVSVGMNVLLLYMEDTYEVEGYPYMGYLRGRYSVEVLKEIDDYAYSLGVEVVPCIQTLGHMSQFMRWAGEKAGVEKSTFDCLLVDDEKTYEFLEACFKTLSGALRSDQINIGMDEAPGMNRGKFYDIHGTTEYYDVFMKHLRRICEICDKYNLKPAMWSDMICHCYSPIKRYHDIQIKFDEKIKKELPENIAMAYWNYGADTYDILLGEHKRLDRDVHFAGGAQTWFGYLPWYAVAADNAHKGLKACLKNNIDFVYTTIWNDDGCETNQFLALNTLPYYTEYCFKGVACTEKDIFEAAEFLTGISEEDAQIMFDVNLRIDDDTPTFDDKTVFLRDLFYSDVLYDMGSSAENCAIVLPKIQENVKKLAASPEKCGGFYEYAYYVQAITAIKAELRINLRKEYKNGNKEYIRTVCEKTLPELILCYEKLYKIFKTMWLRDYKPFGLETISNRFGGIVQRLKDITERMEAYLSDGTPLYELEEEVLPTFGFGFAGEFRTPSMIN